ncbi:hypothetical protein B0H13DRAFT_1901544 [Mycena leptocephala]|nr:hypothetical protein B0H13DRAFT_1901544 [Mycena leptocephala]
MYRHLSPSAAHKGLLHDADESTRPTSAPEDCEAPLVDSATHHRSRKGICHLSVYSEVLTEYLGTGQSIFTMKSAKSLRILSLCCHLTLVVIHLALIPVWVKKLENRVVFTLNYQSIVSFLITAVTQTFGTVYLAVLVLVTQKLSVRHSLVTAQPLTATHDSTAAWAGIGAASLHLWHQKAVRASIIGILSVFLYLGTVLVLHISTPALFSLETFNSTSISVTFTEGLPAMNMSGYNGTTSSNLSDYVCGSLYYLPYVDGTTNIGLTGGTLYDVPKTDTAIGNITVSATGFNVTCQFLENVTAKFREQDPLWDISSGTRTLAALQSTHLRVMSAIPIENIFYSTIPIVDSNNNVGAMVRLDPPMTSPVNVSSIQLFQCFLSLVEQTALFDVEAKKIVELNPDLIKEASTWKPGHLSQTKPGQLSQTFPTTGNPLFDEWWVWYSTMPTSGFPRNVMESGTTSNFLSLADLYLIQKLNLHPANQTSIPRTVTLYDLENTLSELVATMFWTIGHVTPTYEIQMGDLKFQDGIWPWEYRLGEVENPLVLLPGGNTTATNQSIKIRLDVSIGLAGSVVLMLLSLKHSLLRTHHENEQDLPISGTGLLHAIWLYRNHPELELLLEQVTYPADNNLRHAGMVRTRLVGPYSRATESIDKAQLHPQLAKSLGIREVISASFDGF